MKLGGLVVGGEILGTEKLSWRDDDLNGQPPFQAKDALDAGYSDISTIVNWDKFGGFIGRDYKAIRKEIGALIVGVVGANFADWNNLTVAEKEIAARWFCAPASLRETVYTVDELVSLGMAYHIQSVQSRDRRFRVAAMEVYNRLTKAQAQTVVSDIVADGLAEKYVQFGVEGTNEGDVTGLFDYLEATSTYIATGLAAKGYAPTGVTLAELVTRIMDILRNGNY